MRKVFARFYNGFAVLLLSGLVMSCGGGGGGSNSGGSTYTLSGLVSGIVQQGVTITLSGAGTGSTTTNAGGTYSISGLSNGSYTVTATLANYKFSPASQVVVINGANAVAANIVSENAYSILGTVVDGSAVAFAGVTMTLSGPGLASPLTATTDASGNYTFSALAVGDYTVTPSKNSQYNAGSHILTTYSFTPPNQPVTISNADFTGVNFATTVTTTNAYSISGKIISGTKTTTTAPFILGGVTVWLSDPLFTTWISSTTTDANGSYTFDGVPNGNYAVTPSRFHTGSCPRPVLYSFSPVNQAITISGADLPVADFIENVSLDGCAYPT